MLSSHTCVHGCSQLWLSEHFAVCKISNPNCSCSTYTEVCMQLVATANAFVWTFIAMPHLPQDHAVAMRVRFQTYCQLLSLLNVAFCLQFVHTSHAVLQTLLWCFFEVSMYLCECKSLCVTLHAYVLQSTHACKASASSVLTQGFSSRLLPMVRQMCCMHAPHAKTKMHLLLFTFTLTCNQNLRHILYRIQPGPANV